MLVVKGLRKLYERIFAPAPKPFTVIGGQKAIDSNVSFVNSQIFYAALKREERLATYSYLYDNVPIVDGVVNLLVGLANTPLTADTGDAILDREVNEILDYLGIESINAQIDRMLLLFGFCATEYVLSADEKAIENLVVLPSIETRFRVNVKGEVTQVIQLPRTRQMTGNGPQANMIEIPPEKIILMQRNRMGLNSHYGRSLFQTAVASIDSLSKIFDCQLKIYSRFGSPRYVIEVDNSLADSEERYIYMLDQVAAQFAKGDENVLGPAGIKASIVGAEGSALRWKDETNLVVSNILAATGVPSSLLNFNVGGVTESYSRQQVLIMTALIRNLQREKAQAYTRKLMPILSAVYGFKPVKKLRFEPPRLLEQFQEQQARELQRQLDWQDAVDGLISPESFALRQSVPDIDDPQTLQERILMARQQGEAPPTANGSNTNDQTKGTDQRQSTSQAI